MYTLFLSTFDKIITVGLLKDGKTLDRNDFESSRNHSVYTMPMIDTIIKNNNLKIRDIKEIIVINGPGSFTGIRIGVVIAKTLAYTLNIPIKTITSLLAFAISSEVSDKKLVTISDLKGKYVGYFDKDNNVIDMKYLKNIEYEEYIKDKEKYLTKENNLNLDKIYQFLKDKDNVNPHNVNPIYVKGIEALNDK